MTAVDERLSRVMQALALDDTTRVDVSVTLRAPAVRAPMVRALTVDREALPQLLVGDTESGADLGADLVVSKALGEGGMGVVLLARQRSLRRDVAIKRLKRGDSGAGDSAAALLREGVRAAIMIAAGIGAAIGAVIVDRAVAAGRLVVTNPLALAGSS